MNHWKETAEILSRLAELTASGRRAALATVVGVGPVGLDLGADGPRQVALSSVAELLAFIAQREPRHLSEHKEAIHAT